MDTLIDKATSIESLNDFNYVLHDMAMTDSNENTFDPEHLPKSCRDLATLHCLSSCLQLEYVAETELQNTLKFIKLYLS